MSWLNYHTHTDYCVGTAGPEAYLNAALARGMQVLGFSTHFPLPFGTREGSKPELLGEHFTALQQLKQQYAGQIELCRGLEVDYIPGLLGPEHPDLIALNPDYIIGAIHFLDDFPDGRPFELFRDYPTFLRGLRQIYGGDLQKLVTRYFELTRWMVMLEPPDIVAHLDQLRIMNRPESAWDESSHWYRAEVLKTLKTIAHAGSIIEINTRGLYKGKVLDVFPARWILEHVRDLRIPILLSSDCREPGEICAGFEHAARILREIGFFHVRGLVRGVWTDLPFDENGIRLPPFPGESSDARSATA